MHEMTSGSGRTMAGAIPRHGWIAGPGDFGDAVAEDRAARTEAALFDLSGRAHLVLTGADRARFLHGFCTNDIRRLNPGEGCEAFLTSIKGRIVEHVFVRVAEDAIHLDATAGRESALVAHLDKYLIREDVRIAGCGDETGILLVTGPKAEARLASLGVDAATLAAYGHRMASIPVALAGGASGAIAGRLARVDLLAQPGFLWFVERSVLPDARSRLLEAGVVPAGAAVFEPLRIEAGLPCYGIDISEDNLAQEAMRSPRAISFTKGCYLGQEPIARLDALGHLNRQLAVVELDSGPVPERGARVATAEGKESGTITSAGLAPGSTRPVAMGILRSQVCRAGAELLVETAAGPRVSRLRPLPG